MKKFTLVEEDRYINIDGKGIWFSEEDWPFKGIEHLWAIQWKDDGSENGVGHIEYDSAERQNDPVTKECIQRYVDLWQDAVEKQEQEDKERSEQEKKEQYSWSEAMRELETQMEEMQARHDKTLKDNLSQDRMLYDKLQLQVREQEERHASSIMDMMREAESDRSLYNELTSEMHGQEVRHEEALNEMLVDHDQQMDNVHKEISRQHEELFYGQDIVEGQEATYTNNVKYDNITLFDGNVDDSLFDDVIEDSHFADEPVPLDEDAEVKDELPALLTEQEPEESQKEIKKDFNDVDMSVLDDEFNLELLFDDDSDEQIVAEIEELISEDDSGAVLESLVQEVGDDESKTD